METPVPEPSLFLIFGARGDLARRKLIPAFFRLLERGGWTEQIQVLGVGTSTDFDDKAFQQMARQALLEAGVPQERLAVWCDQCLHYHALPTGSPEEFADLARRIEWIEGEQGLPGNRTYYLALPPEVFAPTITALGRAGLHKSRGWVRLVVEKPFGRDRASARELNQTIHAEFSESQVYRIDHYLGKETVQNLLVFRFANAIFESVWNRDRVDHVQITVAEDLGIGTRGRYYETAGALRDMVQNHLTQLVTLVCMEIPATFDANEVHNEKAKVLRSLAPIEKEDVVFGQYTGGRSGGQDVPGYQKEKGVDPVSSIETFAALKLEVANWRWHGVPFYIRTGKRLTRRVSQIVVAFQRPPVSIFRHVVGKESDPNLLAITIQPDDGFDLAFGVKVPGEPIAIAQQSLRFRYAEKFPHVPDAYETLLLDILVGDQTLFNRADLVDESWRIYERVLESPPSVEPYAAGSWGPSGAEDLVARGGRRWLLM